MEYEDEGNTNCIWNNPLILVKGLEDLEIRGKVEIIQTTEL